MLAAAIALATGCAREAAPDSPHPTAPEPPPPSPAAPPISSASPRETASPTPAGAEIRYLALGDSFTIGTGSRPTEAFPARVAERLRARGRAVVLENVAVNGFTTQDILDIEMPKVVPFAPTLVTLAVGANDLVRGSNEARYRSQLKRIFAALAAARVPASSIVALPQPDWSLAPVAAEFGDRREIARRIEAFNAVLREEAQTAGARYVDVFPIMRAEAQRGAFARDGLHPSASAHDAWAEEIAKHL